MSILLSFRDITTRVTRRTTDDGRTDDGRTDVGKYRICCP